MAYGILKCDNITFDNGGSDQNVTVSGLYRATTSGVTVTGTISGAVLVGTTTVSGATVTGNVVQGTTVQGVSGTFTSLTGTTTTGTTANFASGVFTTRVSGTIITGDTGQFTSGTFVSLTGTTITGTTINAVTVSSTTGTFTSLTGTTITGTTINGVTVAATTGSFTSLTGTTTSGTTANFVSGVFTTQVSGTTVTGTTSNFTSGNFATLSGATATFTSGIIALGTATNPSLSFVGDPNTGIYSPGADQLAVATNGTQRLTVDTAATTSTLPVVHPLGVVGTPSITFTGDLNTGFWSPSADALAASTAGSERLRITSAGLVGIGTSAPGSRLTVAQGGSISFELKYTGAAADNQRWVISHAATSIDISCLTDAGAGGGNFFRFNRSAQQLQSFQGYQNAVAWFHVDNSTARVGIGTTSPATTLDVNGDVTITDKIIHASDTNTAIRFPADDTVSVETAGTERLRITSAGVLQISDAGNITVGTTTGTKIGTATTQKLGFYNATPVVQPAAVANATTAVDVITQLNDLLAKLRTLGIIAT